MLQTVCADAGLVQVVREPTRGDCLLDLVLTDLDGIVTATSSPMIADHRFIVIAVRATVPALVSIPREIWAFRKADWPRLKKEAAAFD